MAAGPSGADVAAEPSGADVASEPTWRAGPPHRYDVALRPRGRVRVARAQEAPKWQGGHVGARVGRPVSRSREELVG